MNAPDREAWVDRAVALLEHSAESLDVATLLRLNRACRAALAQQQRFAVRRWWFAGGMATAALGVLIAFGLGVHRRAAPPSPVPLEQGIDPDLLAGDDNLDLYENLDFYAWLDAEQQGGDG